MSSVFRSRNEKNKFLKITAIILAGGKSTRMGQDKGLMLFDGKPMIEHIINTVNPIVNNIIIITNNKKYTQFGHPIYADIYTAKGPLAGIHAGLSNSTTSLNFVLSCDTPFINQALLNLLKNNYNNEDVIIPKKENDTHPLIGIYNKSCLDILKNELANNRLKLKLAIQKMDFKIIDANQFNTKLFNNINSKNDIET